MYATMFFGESRIRSGCLLAGLLRSRSLFAQLTSASDHLKKITRDELVRSLDSIVSGSAEDKEGASDGSSFQGHSDGAVSPSEGGAPAGSEKSLSKYAIDLTAKAKAGKIDPIVGRDEEIRKIVDILMRRRQNNPILTGEAGVGKTAVVEGFALRIAEGTVPPPIKDVRVMALDIGLLQAGAGMKGEFEKRLRSVIEEVQASTTPIILFVDEAHMLIGAGGSAGTGDAANLLKPALARGELRTIAATTWAEYKKHIEPDPALTRRFQVVAIEEPDEQKGILMLRAMAWGAGETSPSTDHG